MYPGSTKESIHFLNNTIVFNPKKRLTIDEALEHPLFKDIRNLKFETTSKNPVVLEFDKEDELPEDVLRKLFLEEI